MSKNKQYGRPKKKVIDNTIAGLIEPQRESMYDVLLENLKIAKRRFFEDWTTFTGVPSKLLERLDLESDLQSSSRYIYNCIKKVYLLASAVSQESLKSAEDTPAALKRTLEDSSFLERPASISRPVSPLLTPQPSFQSRASSVSNTSASHYRLLLPEHELLDFVLLTPYTMELKAYHSVYGFVPMRDIYKDKVWPVPSDFIPYDVFEKPYDCITEFPKDKRGMVKSSEDTSVVKEGSLSVEPSEQIIELVSEAARSSRSEPNE